jgi:hypothetical protein
VFARIREHGHNGTHPRLAWFEWSADAEIPRRGRRQHVRVRGRLGAGQPGLGIRVSVEAVEDELRALDRRTFAVSCCRRRRLARHADGGHAIISQEDWEAIQVARGRRSSGRSVSRSTSHRNATWRDRGLRQKRGGRICR